MRILVVEDELYLAEALTQILKKQNYTVDAVYDGMKGLDCALSGIYDLIVLDIMLPQMDGLRVLSNLRQEDKKTPVILLTAKSDITDKVTGLDAGADDYLPKPFATEELLARIRAMTRRRGVIMPEGELAIGDIILQTNQLKLLCKDKFVKLTLKESELLELLIRRQGMVSPKELIIEKLWGYDSDAEYNNVEVYISFLRKKLGYLASSVCINTIRGIGYMLEEQSNV